MRLIQRAQQRGRVLLERGGGGAQGLLVVGGQFLAQLRLARLRLGPGLGHAAGRRFQAGRHAFQQTGLRFGLAGDVLRGQGQCFADFLLARHVLVAGCLPFLAQSGGHGGQRIGPGGQAFVVLRGQG
ncbi:hypothetical protein D3C73_1015280 [compost metagenome]